MNSIFRVRFAWYLLAALVAGPLLYLVTPILSPFLFAAILGLHPVVVIFALLVVGHLSGFFGVLLALPASAALLVCLRHLRTRYLAGEVHNS